MRLKDTLIIASITLLLLLIAEFISQQILSKTGDNKSFFYKNQDKNIQIERGGRTYNHIDPLLGWGNDYSEIDSSKFKISHNTVLIKGYHEYCDEYMVIYVSGGSTTDLLFDDHNWPIYLSDLLREKGYCIKVYVAAVAGYNSGQELLKLMRGYTKITPDFHISYSGANEMENPSYVSHYEQKIFNHLISDKSSVVLPNLFHLLNKWFFEEKHDMVLIPNEMHNADVFWESNIRAMHGLAIENQYDFIAILQPVLGFGSPLSKSVSKEERFYHHVEDYNLFYPSAKSMAAKHSFAYDFTNTFEHINENVFRDDCHLKSKEYQRMMAKRIISILSLDSIQNSLKN